MPAAHGLIPALLQRWEGVQSALEPAGIQAERINDLWWLFFSVLAAIWVAVMVVLVWSLVRGRGRAAPDTDERTGRRQRVVVGTAIVASALVLVGLATADFATGRAIASLAASHPDPIVVRVTGYQWWWDVQYVDSVSSRSFTTANEIVVPVGRPVRVNIEAADVIHSFWVPNLHGKRDLIPGYSNNIWIRADEPGIYRGQCAEYCGDQHARMALFVRALEADSFDAWYAGQLRPAATPTDSSALRGMQVFTTGPCAMCHTVRGTPAGGRVGPDLTHLASRASIAAGTLPNTRGHLGGWIVNSQAIKPGNRMPPMPLSGPDLTALLDYLETLR
ncbi:MAG TPA: cytochrome c oxidase subunit II [Longimicrobiales bacterium]